MITKNDIVIVFDLDDTLCNEIDYLESAYKEISIYLSHKTNKPAHIIFNELITFYREGLNAFEEIIIKYNLKVVSSNDLLHIYRNHFPNIKLSKSTNNILIALKKNAFKVGLITDGRSVQQRNKIKALQLLDYFDDIIISEEFGSEKPNIKNYLYFQDKYKQANCVYIADNTQKDFISPNKLGWITICLLDNGKNIHKQDFNLRTDKKPLYVINHLSEVNALLK